MLGRLALAPRVLGSRGAWSVGTLAPHFVPTLPSTFAFAPQPYNSAQAQDAIHHRSGGWLWACGAAGLFALTLGNPVQCMESDESNKAAMEQMMSVVSASWRAPSAIPESNVVKRLDDGCVIASGPYIDPAWTGAAGERAAEIMRREPLVERTAEVSKSFTLPVNVRPPLSAVPFESITAVHGSTLATIVSCLRNSNGQVVPSIRLRELGIVQRTGQRGASEIKSEEDQKIASIIGAGSTVSAGCIDQPNGFGAAYGFALTETGYKPHFFGMPERFVASEASSIPVIIIGEGVDPDGHGAATHAKHYSQETADALPEGNPMKALTLEQRKQVLALRKQWERVNIRILLVWDPQGSGKEGLYRGIVQELLRLISCEQNVDTSDVRVHILDEAPDGRPKNVDEVKRWFLAGESKQ